MRPDNKSDGTYYYEYILLYTDDALVVSKNAEETLRKDLGRYFELKEDSIGYPNIYLGGHCRRLQLENGVEAWGLRSSKHVQAAVNNVEEYVKDKDNLNVKIRAETPMQTAYRPELYVRMDLTPVRESYYMSLIGILRWIVELGRVDICLEVSTMSSHMAMPRQ